MDSNSKLVISSQIREKLLEKHEVTEDEVTECFCSRGKLLVDTREDHATDPPTLWFIGETNYGKRLKVVFVEKDGVIFIKTAYPPNSEEERIYRKYGQ
ncbi:MAG: hypothetical protein AB2556_14020 [Candidatus Thiodiazotropha sp.]|nr:MAG: ADP-ribosyl-(dinitrogen reductase) hydrolase [gamma proteobacterium symbiont of Ctena orbiculata]